jgi:hypothetical protein
MNARTLILPLAAALPIALSTPALANPHGGVILMPARTSTLHVNHPTRVKHVVFPPVNVPVAPAFVPAYSPFAYSFPYWQSGFGALSLMNIGGFGHSSSCQNGMPRTLGDLGSAGPGSSFAPVTLSSEPSLGMLPTDQPLLPAQSYCQSPSLDLSTFSFGE